MIKIRLTYADDEEKDIAIEKIRDNFEVLNISKEYKGLSFNKLSRQGKVDDSYIVSIIICEKCQDYIIQIENCVI